MPKELVHEEASPVLGDVRDELVEPGVFKLPFPQCRKIRDYDGFSVDDDVCSKLGPEERGGSISCRHIRPHVPCEQSGQLRTDMPLYSVFQAAGSFN